MTTQPCPVYLFRSQGFAPAGDTVVCVAPAECVIAVYGGEGPFGTEGLSSAFGGAVVFRNDETGCHFLGVWGRRYASRFRSDLRRNMPISICQEAPDARQIMWHAADRRPSKIRHTSPDQKVMRAETFVLKFLSPQTGCSIHEMRFEANPAIVASILVTEFADLATHSFYPDKEELFALASAADLLLPEWDGEIMLTRPHRIDEASYLVHTNFELPLMLEGRKPFAILDGEEGVEWFENVRNLFRPHVESGAFVESVKAVRGGGQTFLTVYYALPGEEWRFKAYDDLMNGPRPWTEEMERRQGYLLGYTQEECDWWIANDFRHPSPTTPY